jgi:hypothetical protein
MQNENTVTIRKIVPSKCGIVGKRSCQNDATYQLHAKTVQGMEFGIDVCKKHLLAEIDAGLGAKI